MRPRGLVGDPDKYLVPLGFSRLSGFTELNSQGVRHVRQKTETERVADPCASVEGYVRVLAEERGVS